MFASKERVYHLLGFDLYYLTTETSDCQVEPNQKGTNNIIFPLFLNSWQNLEYFKQIFTFMDGPPTQEQGHYDHVE